MKKTKMKECKPNKHKVRYDRINNISYCVKCKAVIENYNW